MESFEDRLALDAEYLGCTANCQDAWRAMKAARVMWPQGGCTSEALEYDRLCELREARFMAIKREWEAGQ